MPRPLLTRRMLLALALLSPGCTRMMGPGRVARGARRSQELRSSSQQRISVEEIAGHPRLFVRPDDLPRFREALKFDRVLQRWDRALLARGERLLNEEPIQPPRGADEKMIQQSRAARHRIADLAGLYLLHDDERFARRAHDEMLAAAEFPDWNPQHFLDTAEMTFAMAVGYDWLYDYLSERERRTVSNAILRLGLQPGLNDYRRDVKWTKLKTNWALVCNGGLVVGALAVLDENRKLAEQILSEARPRLAKALEEFAPDGGYPEGPGYWNYATAYSTYALAAAHTALGHAWDLEEAPGFAQAGLYRIHAIGPTGKQFNYGDAIEKPSNAPQMFWFATHFKRPECADHEEQFIMSTPLPGGGAGKGAAVAENAPDNTAKELHIFHVLWHPKAIGGHAFEVPNDALFRGIDVACFRSSFTDPDALYVAVKGGDNRAGHSHLDLGSFVFDAFGQRWAVDLGPEDYASGGYFKADTRYTHLRTRTEAHNTLTLNNENQFLDGRAPVVTYDSTPARSHAVIDLSNAYRNARRVQRGVAMINGSAVLVQDEIDLTRAGDVAWAMLTEADVRLDRTSATLAQNGKSVRLALLSPADATFAIEDLNADPSRKQPTRARKLVVRLRNTRQATIAVMISTDAARSRDPLPRLDPLARWSGPLRR